MPDFPITDSEREIMEILWQCGESVTVSEIMERLEEKRGWKLTTVLTFLTRLSKKGAVEIRSGTGRAKQYVALLSKQAYTQQATDAFVQTVFDGSMDNLVAGLAQYRNLTQGDIAHLRRMFLGDAS